MLNFSESVLMNKQAHLSGLRMSTFSEKCNFWGVKYSFKIMVCFYSCSLKVAMIFLTKIHKK